MMAEIGLFLLVGKLVLNIKDALNGKQIILIYLTLKRNQSLRIHINYKILFRKFNLNNYDNK